MRSPGRTATTSNVSNTSLESNHIVMWWRREGGGGTYLLVALQLLGAEPPADGKVAAAPCATPCVTIDRLMIRRCAFSAVRGGAEGERRVVVVVFWPGHVSRAQLGLLLEDKLATED